MKVTKEYVEGIFKTLPIGYYLGRDIPCELSDKDDTSYFSPTEQKIVVAYGQVAKACEHNVDMETAVRSVLYHEISHAILTPRKLYVTDITNIFEDERIETLMSDTFMGVDFWQNRLGVNGFTSIDEIKNLPMKTDMQKFYALVRFHIGPDNFLQDVQDIIQKYKDLYFNESVDWKVNDYYWDILSLYDKYCQNAPDENELMKMLQDMLSKMSEGDGDGQETDQESEGQGKAKSRNDKQGNQKGKGKGIGKIDIASILTPHIDHKLKETIEQIFEQFNSRSSFCSGATCGYSGIINPRLCNREDYRYFMRKSQKGGMNGFAKFNLNLFIDDSGSFEESRDIVNNLLTILIEIEKNNPDFSLTLIKCGEGQEIVETNRHIDCESGTELTKDIYWQFPKVQKAGYVNYNILLYDGSATYGSTAKRYEVFNTNNTTIIIDTDDSEKVKKYCPNARKIILTKDYAENLIENVVNTLKIALR